MSSPRVRRTVAGTVALFVGTVGGVAVGLSVQSLAGGGTVTRSSAILPTPAPPVARPSQPAGSERPVVADTLLAWTPGGLPPGFAQAVRHLRGVDHLATVVSGTAWMDRSFAPDGTLIDRGPHGMAYPLEVAGSNLSDYAWFLSAQDRALLPDLAKGQGVLGSTSAQIRRLGRGGRLVFGRRTIQVAGVLPDTAIGAHEVFVSRETATRLGITLERYLLIDPSTGVSRKRLTARITRLLPPGVPIRIRGPGETPYFRQGDAVLPTVKMKELFGEFAGRPLPDGTIVADPAWSSRNITIDSVPILGNVQCNRAIFPQLRGALREIEADGLSYLIDPSQYGGCWVPRFVNRNPAQEISHHSWGVAIDINVTDNPYGRTPHMNPRVVAAFEHWGFTWGGRWLRPDGMHFEFISSPAASS